MGWRERDYSQERMPYSDGPFGGAFGRPGPAAWRLMLVHGVVFVGMLIVRRAPGLAEWIALSEAARRPTGVLLHPFALGLNVPNLTLLMSIFSAMFLLWALLQLGTTIENRLGSAWMLTSYAVANVLAGLGYVGIAAFDPAFAGYPLVMPIGALAAWAWWGWRNIQIDTVMIFSSTMRAGNLIGIIAVIYIGLTVLGRGFGTLAWLAAIGAACLAPGLVDAFNTWRERRAQPTRVGAVRRRALRAVERAETAAPATDAPEDDVDEILAKISREGIDALTSAERARLEAARLRRLGK